MIDVLASRYGWLPHQIDDVEWRIARSAQKQSARDAFERWSRAAFITFQSGAGRQGETFGAYIKRVGLIDPDKAEKQRAKPRSEALAERERFAMRVAAADNKRSRGPSR